MMRRCNLSFDFEQKDRKFRAGDVVTGHLVIQVLQDITVKAVHMHLEWRGSVNNKVYMLERVVHLSTKDKTNRIKLELEETELKAGQSYRLPFSFEAPVGPLSYQGTNLHLDWQLQASLDLPKELALTEPKANTRIWIAAKEGQAINLGPRYEKPPKIDGYLEGGNYFGPIFTVLIAGGILWYLYSGNPFDSRQDTLLFWVVLIISLLTILMQVVYYLMAEELASTFKQLEFSLDSQQVMPGHTLDYTFLLEPKKDTHVEQLRLELKGFEFVGGGQSQGDRNFREVIHEQTLELLSDKPVAAGELIEKTGKIVIPASAPCTFIIQKGGSEAVTIRIKYELEFLLELSGGTSKRQTYQIDVVPWLDRKNVDAESSN